MKIMTVNAQIAPALRSLAEDRSTVGAVAQAVPGGALAFNRLASLPGLPMPLPVKGLNYVQTSALQHTELEYIAKEFVLPAIKAMWPDASTVVTGVEIVWATKDVWDSAADDKADTQQTVMAGVKLASKIAGLYLGATHAPREALLTNQIAGFVVATTDKVYSAKLKALAAA